MFGKCVALSFTLPSALKVEAVFQARTRLNILESHRTLRAGERNHLILVRHPQDQAIEAGSVTLQAVSGNTVEDLELSVQGWAWTPNVRAALTTLLDSDRARGRSASQGWTALQRYLTTVALEQASVIASLDLGGPVLLIVDGAIARLLNDAGAILASGRTLELHNIRLQALPFDDLTLVLLPEPATQAFIEHGDDLVELAMAPTARPLPFHPELAEAMVAFCVTSGQPVVIPAAIAAELPTRIEFGRQSIDGCIAGQGRLCVFLRSDPDNAVGAPIFAEPSSALLGQPLEVHEFVDAAGAQRCVLVFDTERPPFAVQARRSSGQLRWLRTLAPEMAEAQGLLRRWDRLLAGEDRHDFRRAIADPLRSTVARRPSPVPTETFGQAAGPGPVTIVWDEDGDVGAVEQTLAILNSSEATAASVAIASRFAGPSLRHLLRDLAGRPNMPIRLVNGAYCDSDTVLLATAVASHSGALLLRAGTVWPGALPELQRNAILLDQTGAPIGAQLHLAGLDVLRDFPNSFDFSDLLANLRQQLSSHILADIVFYTPQHRSLRPGTRYPFGAERVVPEDRA